MFYSFCWWLCMIWIRVMYHVEIVAEPGTGTGPVTPAAELPRNFYSLLQ